jgi:hypothetical protein
MLKKLSTMFAAINLTIQGFSQLPDPEYLKAGTSIVDNTPYKLIFNEDFNGTELDRSKWRTYASFMSWGGGSDYHPDWNGFRYIPDRFTILRDENVEVSGGTCKLKLINVSSNWKCDGCPESSRIYANATAGTIQTYFRDPITDALKTFNSGKFEFKARFPTHDWTHACVWLWKSSGVNELDFAESYGNPYFPGGMSTHNNRRLTYSTHSWTPSLHSELSDRFPNQQWIDYSKGNYLQQREWHTYTCEWDANRISFYFDGKFLKTLHKYYKNERKRRRFLGSYTVRSAAPDIIPVSEYYNVYEGFPYSTKTYANLLFWNGFDHKPGPLSPEEAVQPPNSTLEIDYVKIWQRHPELDNYSDQCTTNTPLIAGPSILNSSPTYTYTVSNPIPGGTWLILDPKTLRMSTKLGISITSASSSSCTVSRIPSLYREAIIGYLYSIPGCLSQMAIKRIDLGTPLQSPQFIVKTNINTEKVFQLAAPFNYNTPTEFEWIVNYGNGKSITANGQYISTPIIDVNESDDVNWTLTVSNEAGQSVFSGNNYNKLAVLTTPQNSQNDSVDLDTNIYYYNAIINDTNAYINAVANEILSNPIIDSTDTTFTNTMIEKIMFDQLAPYIEIDSTMNSFNTFKISPIEAITKIYPNPTTNLLNISLGSEYDKRKPIEICLFNLLGKIELKQTLDDNSRNKLIDLSPLSNTTYIIEIKQGSTVRRAKITKQ